MTLTGYEPPPGGAIPARECCGEPMVIRPRFARTKEDFDNLDLSLVAFCHRCHAWFHLGYGQ